MLNISSWRVSDRLKSCSLSFSMLKALPYYESDCSIIALAFIGDSTPTFYYELIPGNGEKGLLPISIGLWIVRAGLLHIDKSLKFSLVVEF